MNGSEVLMKQCQLSLSVASYNDQNSMKAQKVFFLWYMVLTECFFKLSAVYILSGNVECHVTECTNIT